MRKLYMYKVSNDELDSFYVATDLNKSEFDKYLKGIIENINNKYKDEEKSDYEIFLDVIGSIEKDEGKVVIDFLEGDTEYVFALDLDEDISLSRRDKITRMKYL